MTFRKLYAITKLVSVGCVGFAAVAIGITALHFNKTITQADNAVAQLNTTIEKVNGKYGTIYEVNMALTGLSDLVRHLGKVADKTQKAEEKEIAFLDTANNQVSVTLGNINEAVVAVKNNENQITDHTTKVLDATTESVKELQPTIVQLRTTLAQAQQTEIQIGPILTNLQTGTAEANTGIATMNHTLKQADDEVYSLLHPTWPRRVWSVTLDVVKALKPW